MAIDTKMSFQDVLLAVGISLVLLVLVQQRSSAKNIMNNSRSLDSQILFSKNVTYSPASGHAVGSESIILYASGRITASAYDHWQGKVDAAQLEKIKTFIRDHALLKKNDALVPASQDMTLTYTLHLDGKSNSLVYGDRLVELHALEKMIFTGQDRPNPLGHL